MYISTEDGKITGVYCGPLPAGATEVPDDFNGATGEEVAAFDYNWKRKPAEVMFEEKKAAGKLTVAEENAPVWNEMRLIDFLSIASIREWIAKREDAPEELKNLEARFAELKASIKQE